jgi:hypothetical protein
MLVEAATERLADRSPDRRAKIRYAINLRVRYQRLRQNDDSGGVGETIDFSSGGLLVSTSGSQYVPVEDSRVRVLIPWPVMLNGETFLEFAAWGTVVRSESTRFAVSFTRHEFHTIKRKVPVAVDHVSNATAATRRAG